ncbi:hypothetical protein IV102_22545 [bacterium]|nr:hypothetical protein [bacterium]
MKEAQSLDEYLAALYDGAQLDSQGKFTIDLDRRMQKLARHQLRNPENFVLSLLSAATLGGATRFDLSPVSGGFRLEFDGQPIDSAQLQRVHSVLSKGSVETGDARLQHLGMALNLVQNLHCGDVQLHVTGCIDRLVLSRNGWQRIKGGADPNCHCLIVQGGSWNLFRFLFDSRALRSRQAVSSLLQKRCCFGPPTLHVDQARQLLPWMDSPLTCLTINGGAPEGPAPARLEGQLDVPDLASMRGVILLGEESPIQQTLLIAAGVAYPLRFRQLPKGGCQILIWCDDFKTDMTMEALVEDAALSQLLRYLPCWINESQLAVLANLYAGQGMKALLNVPDLAITLWSYRQQVTHQLPDFKVRWSGGEMVPLESWSLGPGEVSVACASRAYRRLGYLPVTHPGEPVEGSLDDGSPVLARPNPHDGLLSLLFPVQREFVFFQGRGAPRLSKGNRILDEPLFFRCTPMLFDAQIGLNLRADGRPGQVWRYTNWAWLDGWEAPQTGPPFQWVPPGATLAVLTLEDGDSRLTESQLCQLLGQLYSNTDPSDLYLEHRLRALLYWRELEVIDQIMPGWTVEPLLKQDISEGNRQLLLQLRQ